MELKPGYKETDLGPLPSDWKTAKLEEVGLVINGLTYAPSDVRSYGTLVLRSSNIQNDALAFEDNVFVDMEIPERIMVRPDDVLICVRNGSRILIGKTALLDERTIGMAFGAFMAVFRSDHGRYVNYLFRSHIMKRQIDEHLGATINQITNKSLKSFQIPVPPTDDEIDAIATALSDVDALLDGLDRLIAKKRDLKQAAMQQLLTGETRLPGFADEWELKRLGDHVTFLRNGVNSRAELTLDDPVKYLHYGDIHSCTSVMLEPASLPSLPSGKAKTLERLRDGDLIFADASEDLVGVSKSVEISNLCDAELVAGLHTIAARFDKAVLADGFKAYLQFCPAFSRHLRRLAAGTKVYATNRSHIASVEMRLPGIKEQEAIAATFNDMDAEIASLEQRRAKTKNIKQAMMQELLTGKTRLVTPGGSNA